MKTLKDNRVSYYYCRKCPCYCENCVWLIRFKSQLYQGHELAYLYNWNYTVSSFCEFIEHIEDNVNELAKTTNYNDNNIFPHNKHHTSPATSILRITYM